jgi:PAS domain S-box-containing protein
VESDGIGKNSGVVAPTDIWAANSIAWLAAIVESSDDAIVGKTLDSIIRSWNPAATRMFGYEPHEIIGRPVTTLMPPELQYQEAEIVAKLVRGERIDHFETIRVRKDGKRLEVSLSVSPIRDDTGKIIGAAKVARDITEANRLRRAEQELVQQLQDLTMELEQQLEESQALQEELEATNDDLVGSVNEAQKARKDAETARHEAEDANAAKSQFLAKMSHELRTPLNAIAGYVELLELEIRGPITQAQRDDLARIRRSSDTLRRLIEDVLNFAKLESGRLQFHYEMIALGPFLGTLEAFIAPRVERKGLRYRLESGDADITVRMDQDKVQQIILNLLSNAVKFTDAGEITLRCHVSHDTVAIQVVDTGKGVPANALESIFEPFVQAGRGSASLSEGTGLGLSISRELARAMGGDVTVESEEGKGSTFSLVLPR